MDKAFFHSLSGDHTLINDSVTGFVLADQSRVESEGECSIAVEIGELKIDMQFSVMTGLSQQVIIGRDLLKAHQFNIDFHSSMITINPVERLFTLDRIILEPRSSSRIELQCNRKRREVTKSARVQPCRNNPYSSIMNSGNQIGEIRHGRIQIEVTNRGDRVLEITQGTNLAVAIATQKEDQY